MSVAVPVSRPAQQPSREPSRAGRTQSPHRTSARIVWGLAGLNLVAVGAVLILVFGISERWWPGTIATYLPRAPWAIPSLVLIVAGLFWHRPSLWLSVLSLLLVLGPLMEFRAPVLAESGRQATVAETVPSLRLVSANTQMYKPDFAGLLAEVNRLQPDIVVFQEAFGDHPLLTENFPDWHRLHLDRYWIGSRYPLTLKHEIQSEAFDREVGIIVEVATPQGKICVVNIHQMTARRGLQELSPRDLLTGESLPQLENFQMLRLAESGEIRQAIQTHTGNTPFLVAGDFNTPASSSLFQSVWGDLTSAFDVAGTGYGYTSPVKPHRYWINYLPWARIDHVLCSPEWQVRDCRIGLGRGSDHHLIYAELACITEVAPEAPAE